MIQYRVLDLPLAEGADTTLFLQELRSDIRNILRGYLQ
jgi:hypothetical protein